MPSRAEQIWLAVGISWMLVMLFFLFEHYVLSTEDWASTYDLSYNIYLWSSPILLGAIAWYTRSLPFLAITWIFVLLSTVIDIPYWNDLNESYTLVFLIFSFVTPILSRKFSYFFLASKVCIYYFLILLGTVPFLLLGGMFDIFIFDTWTYFYYWGITYSYIFGPILCMWSLLNLIILAKKKNKSAMKANIVTFIINATLLIFIYLFAVKMLTELLGH